MAVPHPKLQAQLTAATKELAPGLELRFRAMFGGAGVYAYEQMFASLSDVGLALKLAPEVQERLLKLEGAKRLQYDDSMPPSKVYVVVPPQVCAEAGQLAEWVGESLEYISKLPAKKNKGG